MRWQFDPVGRFVLPIRQRGRSMVTPACADTSNTPPKSATQDRTEWRSAPDIRA